MSKISNLEEEILKIDLEIQQRTEKFNNSIKKLKDKKADLTNELKIEQGKVALEEKAELEEYLAQRGMSRRELLEMLKSTKKEESVGEMESDSFGQRSY